MVVLAGIEDPRASSDSIQWIDVRVRATPNLPSHDLQAPPIDDDVSSVCIIRDHYHDNDDDDDDSAIYFLWRIHKNNPHVLEILQSHSFLSFPSVGLRITFPSILSPFASICKNECQVLRSPYMLYTMTADGILRLIYLDNVTNYQLWHAFSKTDDLDLEAIHVDSAHGTITSIAAITGFVVIGKEDGWVGCLRLGSLEACSEGFQYELQEDPANIIEHFVMKFSRRTRTPAPVKDLLCQEIRGRKLAFVLFEDGLLQLWDLLRCTRFMDNMLKGMHNGSKFMRIWAGETNFDSHVLPLAILHQSTLEDTISVYRCHICLTWIGFFVLEPPNLISMEKDSIIDVKLSSNDNIYILVKDGVVHHNLLDVTKWGTIYQTLGERNNFGSLEPIVAEQLFQDFEHAEQAEQLFQDSEHAGNDALWLINSVFPCAKEKIYNRVHIDSIFMRMLFLPAIFHKSVLGATFQVFKKQISDSELHALDHSGVKGKIRSIIEHEV